MNGTTVDAVARPVLRCHRLLRIAALIAASAIVGPGLLASEAGAQQSTAPQTAKVIPDGKMTVAWHTNIAPRWLDPQDHDGTASPDNFLMAVHDALIKNFRDKLYDHTALAEKWEFAEDAKSATFWLRPNIKFHNGDPVTPEDVKFTFEHYRGAWKDVLKTKTERVEIVDARTVKFHFKEPFLDFPLLFGTANVSGAGWVVPAKYYQQVGPDGFKQKPIGAGPYKLVSQQAGTRVELEAFEDYYRPVHIKHITMVSIPEAATRMAMLERGEADLIYFVPGDLIEHIQQNKKLMLAPVLSGNWWLEFPGFQDPKSPFHDKRVREAISLAVDRDAINDAETGGMGKVDGNWINDDVQYALQWPAFKSDVEQAKKLMKDAGMAGGIKVDWLTPLPTYYSRGERVISQLQDIGIKARLQVMERGVFLAKLQGGLKEWPGTQIIMQNSRIGGSWSNWYESFFKCGGFNVKDRICVKALDDKFGKYIASFDRKERETLAGEIQREILENYYLVPVFRHAFVNAIGPRIAASKWQDVFPTITTGYAHPWEDIKLKP